MLEKKFSSQYHKKLVVTKKRLSMFVSSHIILQVSFPRIMHMGAYSRGGSFGGEGLIEYLRNASEVPRI